MNQEYLENIIDEDQILKFNKNEVFIRGNKLTKEQRTELKEAAKSFCKNPMYKFMTQEIRNESFKALYQASNEKEVVAGQMMIFNLEIMDKLINKVKDL